MSNNIVIVGAGLGGCQLAFALRKEQFKGSITLVGDEPHMPYHRPPLSKEHFVNYEENTTTDTKKLDIKSEALYQDRKIDVIRHNKVMSINTDNKTVTLESGMDLSWNYLVLSTGSRARTLDIADQPLEGICHLRTIDDVRLIQQSFANIKQLVIIGGGYIGLEIAAAASKAGKNVTILENQQRVLQRVVAPALSAFYEDVHQRHGVEIACNTNVTGFRQHEGAVTGVITEENKCYPAQMVIVGIGVIANDTLAASAGLDCSNGIDVDSLCRTSNKDIFAIGDCCNFPSQLYARSLRIESVPNTNAQAIALAKTLCDSPTEHFQLPWFWSDQYNLKLKMAGMTEGYDETVIRGKPSQQAFSIFYLRENKLIAVHCVNRPADFMAAKKLIAAKFEPNIGQLADPAYALKDVK